jgi:PIN domain nuclease of toxin-antitoxin system
VTFVADTHALVWHLMDEKRLGKAARRAFRSADRGLAHCYIPAIALVEISLLHEKGRLRTGPARVAEALAAHAGYAILALDLEQALGFASLPTVRDPMDRLILAAARAVGAQLVSADEALDGQGVERVWD